MDAQQEAWDRLYGAQGRLWRGITDLGWTDIAPGMKVLDLGCGNGKTAAALLESGADVTGLDFSSEAVASCERLFGAKAEFLQGDVRTLPFPDEAFDRVLAFHVLEHLSEEDFPRGLSEAARVLRKGGRLYLKCFAEEDMRSSGRKEDVRNGIRYRYLSEEDILAASGDLRVESVRLVEEPTRFGTVRRRYECILVRP